MTLRSFTQWLQQLQLTQLLDMVVIVAASLLCITVHETCHGLAAWAMGDDTAKRMGRLSLNPLRHVDLMGLIMMALLRFGWAKAVPVNMSKFRNPKIGMALTAIAGPLSNVLLLFLAILLRSVCYFLYFSVWTEAWLSYLILFLEYVAVLSAGLAVFNLFPIPPLDGSKVLFALLPQRAYDKLMRYERYGMILLAVLLFTNVIDQPLTILRDGLLDCATAVSLPLLERLLGL